MPRRNTTAVQAAWTARRWQWARDLRALRRARADRRRGGIRPGTGTYDESTEAVLRRYSTLADPAHRAGDTSSKGGDGGKGGGKGGGGKGGKGGKSLLKGGNSGGGGKGGKSAKAKAGGLTKASIRAAIAKWTSAGPSEAGG